MIIGSFRGRGGKELDQHYVSLSYLHEPKGGILPLEVEEDPSEEEARGPQNADGGGKARVGTGWAGGKSPQARSSEIAKRFSRWIREQRLAVLRGFGAEEAEEDEIKEEGKDEDKQNGAGSDDAVAPPGGTHKDEDVGAGAAEEGEHREPPGNGNEEPVAASGTGGESSGTGDQGTEGRAFLDPLTPEQDKEAAQAGKANDVDEYGPLIDDKRDSADEGGDGEEAQNDRREVDEDLGDVEEDVDLMDTVRAPPLSASGIIEATVKGVGPGESESEGFAVDVSDVGAAAGEESLIRVDREEETGGEEGTRRWAEEDAREGFAAQQSPPSQPETPLQQPREGDGPSMGGFAQQEESDERTHTFHAFPPADTVTISCRGEPVDRVPNPRADASFTWEADGVG